MSTNTVNKLCILSTKYVNKLCVSKVCQQTLSTNSVFCLQHMSTNYVSANYVNKLCQQIMSTDSVSKNYVSTGYVNKFMSTNYVRKLCRQFNASPGWWPHNYAVNIIEFSHHGIYTSVLQQANHSVGRSLHPLIHTVNEWFVHVKTNYAACRFWFVAGRTRVLQLYPKTTYHLVHTNTVCRICGFMPGDKLNPCNLRPGNNYGKYHKSQCPVGSISPPCPGGSKKILLCSAMYSPSFTNVPFNFTWRYVNAILCRLTKTCIKHCALPMALRNCCDRSRHRLLSSSSVWACQTYTAWIQSCTHVLQTCATSCKDARTVIASISHQTRWGCPGSSGSACVRTGPLKASMWDNLLDVKRSTSWGILRRHLSTTLSGRAVPYNILRRHISTTLSGFKRHRV